MDSPEDMPADQPGPGKPPKKSAAAPTAAPADSAEALVIVTLKADNGSIVKIEAVDPGGSRHELSAEEAAQLLGGPPKATVEGLVHEAFEAGIAWVLDEQRTAAGDEASGETQEDAALHDELLDALIERSPARRLLRREVLESALLGTIISKVSTSAAAGAG